MDEAARPISRKIVSFKEQKKFHREFTKPLLVDVKKILLEERMETQEKRRCNINSKDTFLPVWHF